LSKRERLSKYVKPKTKDGREAENEAEVATLYLEGMRVKTQPVILGKSRR
jgi:hypothetical protein